MTLRPNSDNVVAVVELMDVVTGQPVLDATGTFEVQDCDGNIFGSGATQAADETVHGQGAYYGIMDSVASADLLPSVKYTVIVTLQSQGRDGTFQEDHIAKNEGP